MAINKWKVVAIIFIILFILETFLIYSLYRIGSKEINNEIKCSDEICFNKNADNYYYDSSTSTCSCFVDTVDGAIYKEVME